jgi:hypothetical protein
MTHYIHDIPGRLRVKSPVLRFNYSAEKAIAALLNALAGVESVAFNGTTGSCLIYYDRSMTCRNDIVSVLSENGYFNPREAISNEEYLRNAATKFLVLLSALI